MSAIFGIINKTGKPVDEEDINKIKRAIAHRATDGNGLWQNENAALGFCKLSGYPQQQNEQLPFEAGDLILTADARIDNRDELCNLLNLDKLQWQNEPCSLLILKAYQRWAEQCVHYLEGEFVFAIWNKVSQQLFMAGDQIGFRPVFYYNGPDQFVFCSEIKGVVAAKTTPNYFNEEHLIEYHFRQGSPAQTYNKEVFALCGGNAIKLQHKQIKITKYWTLERKGKYHFAKDEEWTACLRDLLYKAIEKRLNFDIPIGVTLSGGLDSTSIACILSEILSKKNKPLYAFSSVLPINYKGIEKDERNYIEIVNKHCPNIIQTFVEAPGVGPFTNVEDAFEKNESVPNTSFYIDRAIAEAASEKKIRILFSGFGGDFWVSSSGNDVIYLLIKKRQLKDALQLINALSETKNKNMLQVFRNEFLVHTSYYNGLKKLLKKKEINWQHFTALQNSFTKKYQLDFTSVKDNSSFMLNSIESGRTGRILGLLYNRQSYYNILPAEPLLDKNINEFLMDIPLKLFMYNGYKRGLIRHAMQGVIPKEIQWRKDKLPYSPAYNSRILQYKPVLQQLMCSDECKFIFDQYISREIMEQYLSEIIPMENLMNTNKITGLRIAQAGISGIVLKHLKRNEYLF